MLAFAGGILGVLMMVPLRRALIVKEHGVLPYPEGTACADVLVAGERGGKLAAHWCSPGLGIGALWKSLSWIFRPVPDRGRLHHAADEPVPERHAERRHLARVHGRRLRHRAAHRRDDVRRRRAVVAGAAAAAVDPRRRHPDAVPADPSELREQPGHRPAVPDLGDERPARSGAPTSATSAPAPCSPPASSRWRRTIPTIVASARDSLKDFGARGRRRAQLRTERDMPMTVVLGGSLLLAIFLAVAPGMPTQGNFLVSHPDHHLRLLLRDRLVAHHRADRILVEPDLGHDDRDADPHVHRSSSRSAGPATTTRRSRSASAPSSASRPPTPAPPRRTSRPATSSAPRRSTSRSACVIGVRHLGVRHRHDDALPAPACWHRIERDARRRRRR